MRTVTQKTTVTIPVPVYDIELEGDLRLPENGRGIVVFVHGSGSSRLSPRNRLVAQEFTRSGTGTLLMDLLTETEEEIDELTGQYRFDIDLLAHRVVAATDWLAEMKFEGASSIGYFGASTGAAAALLAAAQRPELVRAVVSRGGRPDLAMEALPRVKAPTLLIVGAADPVVIEMNRTALEKLGAEKDLVLVPHATHLFEEPGALEEVARLASGWFAKYLKSSEVPLRKG